jgi:tetratricopeptide (TPR) repeat protein
MIYRFVKPLLVISVAVFLWGCTMTVPWGKKTDTSISTPTLSGENTAFVASSERPIVWDEKNARETAADSALGESEKKERAKVLIKRAEYLATNNEYHEAFWLYERALRLSPSDEIERKLAHIAFRDKNFQRSSDLYKKFSRDLYLSEKEEFLHALRYTGDEEFVTALWNLDLPEEVRKGFEVSWKCEHEFISCENAIRTYPYDYAPIRDLKSALKNYENLGNKDPSYKEALLVGAFYKNQDFTTAMRVGENILRRKPDYRPILKIVGFSAFMTGQYERAQGVLGKYKKLEPKDAEADFILGLLHFEKEDYETSNIYFNKAVLGGYKPKTVVERKLAYNYYVLDLPKNMFQVLGYLMLEPDVTEPDITNAIYLALLHDETRNAGEWIKIGHEKFPDSENISGLEIWHLRTTGKTAEAQALADTLLSKNQTHLIGLVQWGILAQEAGYKEKAKTLLKQAKIIDAGGTWEKTIDEYLAK